MLFQLAFGLFIIVTELSHYEQIVTVDALEPEC